MIAKPNIPVVRPARVADDARFMRWIDYAKEALPVDIADALASDEAAERNLDDIPAAIVVKRSKGKGEKASGSPSAKAAATTAAGAIPEPREKEEKPKAQLKNLAGRVPQGKEGVPAKKRVARSGTEGENTDPKPLDTSRFSSFEDYNDGKTRIAPLQRGSAMDGKRGLERPKFMDGKLPRSVERGVLHPAPGRLVSSALLLLVARLLLIAVVIVMPIMAFLDGQMPPETRFFIKKSLPLLVTFLVLGTVFLVVANKARCRVCSCHFFFTRRCHKHKSSHRLMFFGAAGSSALHLLMFKWMRCMYCGTAIRLRGSTGVGKPSKDGKHYNEEDEEAEG